MQYDNMLSREVDPAKILFSIAFGSGCDDVDMMKSGWIEVGQFYYIEISAEIASVAEFNQASNNGSHDSTRPTVLLPTY